MEKFPRLSAEPVYSRRSYYETKKLPVATYLNATWVKLGYDIDDPEFSCPKDFFLAVTDGIEGLDNNGPSNVLNLSNPAAHRLKVGRTPRSVQAAVFEGVTFPPRLRSGKLLSSSSSSFSSSAAQAAAGHSSSFAPSLRSSSSSSFAAQAAAPSDSDASSFHPSDDSGSDSSDDFESDPSDDSDSDDEDDRLEAPPHSSSSSDDPLTAITKKLADELWSRIPCLNPGTKQCRSRTDKLPMDGAAFSRAPPVLIRFFVLCSHTRGQMF